MIGAEICAPSTRPGSPLTGNSDGPARHFLTRPRQACGIIAALRITPAVRMAKATPIQFKGTTLKIIHTLLGSTDPQVLHDSLADLTGNAPDFFEGDLAVLDFSAAAMPAAALDWPALLALLRASGLNPVALRGIPAELVLGSGLALVGDDALGRGPRAASAQAQAQTPLQPQVQTPAQVHIQGQTPAQAEAAAASPAHPPANAAPPSAPVATAVADEAAPAASPPSPATGTLPTVVLDRPLRSGQRFYARGSDLVVLAMVSAGAEVIADGHIHVYAPLRGRALAGASGDAGARIFTTSLEAELVSIAGTYRTFEDGLPADLAGRPAHIRLEEDTLRIAPLALR